MVCLLAGVCSVLATATLCAQPANDFFTNRITITGTNVVVTGNNIGAGYEAGEPFHAGVGGFRSVWWSWTASFTGVATITTAGSSFDTALGIYTGTSVGALATVGSNDDENYPSIATSKVTFSATAGQTYQIAVDGYDGDFGIVQLHVQLVPPLPAPAWVLPDPYGALVYSTNFAGKVVVLNFWASWCVPCKEEIPDIIALQNKYRADGLVVIGATIWDVLQDTITFLGTNVPSLNYQIILADSLVPAFGGVDFIPTTFIINRQNVIVKSYVGTQTQSTFEKQIIPLLYDNMRLTPQKIGNQLILSWPTNAVTFILESAGTPTSPNWVQWPTPPTMVNGSNTVQLLPGTTNRFFRLRLPY